MSESILPVASDMYAKVDLSKKKRKIISDNETNSSKSDIPVYAAVQKSRKSAKPTEEHVAVDNIKAVKEENDSSVYETWKQRIISWLQNKLALIMIISAATALVVLVIMFAVVFSKIAALQSAQNSHEVQSLNNSVNSIYDSLKNEIKNVNMFFHESFPIHFGILSGFPGLPSSCSAVLEWDQTSTSGYYFLRSFAGQLKIAYCEMSETCGNLTGGWMKVAEVDPDHCPPGLKSKEFNNKTKTCVVNEDNGGCTPVFFSVLDIPYSRICGRVRGYAVGTPDAFRGNIGSNPNGNYLDGISISKGSRHIWSYVATESCTCEVKPDFIGDNWSCENSKCNMNTLCDKLLWESPTCGKNSSWFYKEYNNPNISDIEMRVCRDQKRFDEDLAITTIEIYVQ